MARAGIQPIPGRLAFFPIVARRWRIYKYEIDQSAQTDGQQTALFVSYDGDYRYGGNVVIVANPPVTVAHLFMPANTAPASQRMAPTKILSTAPCAKTGAY